MTVTGGDTIGAGGVSSLITSDLRTADLDSPLALAQPSSRAICDSDRENEYVFSCSPVFIGLPDLRGSGLFCGSILQFYTFLWTLIANWLSPGPMSPIRPMSPKLGCRQACRQKCNVANNVAKDTMSPMMSPTMSPT